MSEKQNLLRRIPNMQDCLRSLASVEALQAIPVQRLKRCTREFLEQKRQLILNDKDPGPLSLEQGALRDQLVAHVLRGHRPRFRPVINASGVIIHTNLGRSLLPESAMDALLAAGSRYSNLEFNLDSGKRGSRYSLVEELICEITGAEAALVVNNNAAAVLIVLETLARGKEAIVSRGQLVEIGGSFRIPDVMARSGARLVEVGATNRTHLRDYQQAVTQETGVLLKVHCSNYRIIGFTSEVSNQELVALGREQGIPVVEDLGSGSLIDLSRFGLEKEPTVQEVVASGVDVVTFSGDKLLGGPQAGIIVGRHSIVEQIKNNPLNRALRIDKFTLAGLESILRLYLDESEAIARIPTLQMIAAPVEQVEERARRCLKMLNQRCGGSCRFDLVEVSSRVGGGAMPEQDLASWAIAVTPLSLSPSRLENNLRRQPVPVIGRLEDNRLLFDLRTVREQELELLLEAVAAVCESSTRT